MYYHFIYLFDHSFIHLFIIFSEVSLSLFLMKSYEYLMGSNGYSIANS